MIDIFDMIHYLIGFIIVGCLLWLLIKVHIYFSKDNKPIETFTNKEKKYN
jgi:hypothetical protein